MRSRDAAQRRAVARHGASQLMSADNFQVPINQDPVQYNPDGECSEIGDISETIHPNSVTAHDNNRPPSSHHEDSFENDEPPIIPMVYDHPHHAPLLTVDG